MTTPTMKEMVETFSRVMLDNNWPGVPLTPEAFERGLTAVIEKHIGPMLAEAYMQGTAWDGSVKRSLYGSHAQAYAARIIEQMMKEKKP